MIAFLPLVLLLGSTPGAPAGAPVHAGDYVEARTAAVYAGACHFGGEYTTQGRAAVLGWDFQEGELAGVDLVVAVVADKNLDEADAKRTSVVHLDPALSDARRDAALAWLSANHTDVVGTVKAVKRVPVVVRRDGDAFALRAGTADETTIDLSGTALPERACCKMAYNVWYDPLVLIEGRLVGNTATFRADLPELGRRWSRPDENAVFFGSFGALP